MKSQIAQTVRGSIEFTWQGNGPVVLVCHGTSENCYSGRSLAPLLNAGYSILTISRPGYGRTPSDMGRSSAEAADALIALLNQLEIPQCSVIAISGGGPTGVALAANYPERVKNLVLIAANTYTENRPSPAMLETPRSPPASCANFPAIDNPGPAPSYQAKKKPA
jgi:pimeloyl-ACP methyl ester carboxylesterase